MWLYTDHLGLLLQKSLPYLGLLVVLLGWLSTTSPDDFWLWLVVPPLAVPVLHMALTPVSRTVWTECLGQPLPPAEGSQIARHVGRVFGTLLASLACLLSLGMGYLYFLMIPALTGLERLPWNQAWQRSRRILKDQLPHVLGVLFFTLGLVGLVAVLAVSAVEAGLPLLAAALDTSVDRWGWVDPLRLALYGAVCAMALPLVEVAMVLLYHQIRLYREGADLEEALDRLEPLA